MRTCTLAHAAALFLSGVFGGGVQGQTTRYVDDDASTGGNGVTWNTAYKYLQDALAAAQAGDEIHVAGGVYTPDRDEAGNVIPGDRTATFQLSTGVELSGGYAGLANPANPDQRDIEVYQSILTGDLGSDDGPNFANNAENSYHVVNGSQTYPTAVLDGFTITAGNADGGYVDTMGGGMYINFGRPSVSNCTLTANTAENYGGGMYNAHQNPILTNCTFSGNATSLSGSSSGGGMYNFVGTPVLLNCMFIANVSTIGGGMYNADGSPTLTNCSFSGNSATYYDGGGMYNYRSDSTLTNCTFSENSANRLGGAVGSYRGTAMLADCVFTQNSAALGGGGVYSDNSDHTVVNCIFTGNSAGDSAPYGGGGIFLAGGSGDTLINCAFIGNSGNYGGGVHSYLDGPTTLINCTFAANSASWGRAIACGSDTFYQNTVEMTNCIMRDGGEEVWNGDGSTTTISYSNVEGSWPGIGNIDADPLFVRDPDPGPDGDFDGVDDDYGNLHLWPNSPCIDAGDNDALPAQVTTDLDGLPRFMDDPATPDTGNPGDPGPPIVDMGVYEYLDCNGNGIHDWQDIADGTSEDCDENGMPDECEPDCNDNGAPDSCDIGNGISQDCNENRIPDECDLSGGASQDLDGNGIPDECVLRKNRYISFAPDNDDTIVAFQVEMTAGPGATGVLGWVGETDENDVGRVVADPFFTDAWPRVVDVGDCEIVPVATYEISATADGATFSDPLEVGTIRKPGNRYYGDVVGIGTGNLLPLVGFTPPNGVVNVSDVQALLLTLKGPSTPSAPTTWLDLHGLGVGTPPDYILNVSDLQRILFGFDKQQYLDAPDHMNPADCP